MQPQNLPSVDHPCSLNLIDSDIDWTVLKSGIKYESIGIATDQVFPTLSYCYHFDRYNKILIKHFNDQDWLEAWLQYNGCLFVILIYL